MSHDWDYEPISESRRHPIFDIGDQLGDATDAFITALNDEATAEVAYKRAWSIALLREDDVAATLRSKFAEARCVDEQATWTYATARVKSCRAKCEQLDRQMGAWQSAMRREERVT